MEGVILEGVLQCGDVLRQPAPLSHNQLEILAHGLAPKFFGRGEISLLAGDRRNATVKAIEDVRVVIIDKGAFAGIIHENPEVAAEMASIYYQRSQELTEAREKAIEGEEIAPEEELGEKALLRRIQRFFGL